MKEKLYNLIAGAGIKVMSRVFPEYFAKEPLRPTDRYIEYPFVLSNLPKPPCKILDVGCSGSMFPIILDALGYEVSGIDIRPYPTIRREFIFYCGDICDNPFSGNTFDCITAISTIEHIGLNRYGGIENPYKDEHAIDEIHNLLKPLGTFLMTVPFSDTTKSTPTHRIYNLHTLYSMLKIFKNWKYETVKSPEAEYALILIEAFK